MQNTTRITQRTTHQSPTQKTISFRTESDRCQALDNVAEYLGTDRTHILNQAIDNILDIYAWQLEHAKQGVAEAEAGIFVEEKKWRQSLKGKF